MQQQLRVQEYALAAPTEAILIASLARVLGEPRARETWARARRNAGVAPRTEPLDLQTLRLVVDRLAAEPDLVGVMAVSLRVRLETYSCLAGLPSPFCDPNEEG